MFNIASFSCFVTNFAASAGSILSTNPRVILALGDTPYIGNAFNIYGQNLSQLDKDSTELDFKNHLDQFAAHPFLKSIIDNNSLVYQVTDDHSWGGNDWDHSITNADAGTVGIGTAGTLAEKQAQVNAHWKAGRDAFRADIALRYDNPDNVLTITDAERPDNSVLNSQNPAATDYNPMYWTQGFDISGNEVVTSGHLELIMIDCMSCMDAIGKIDDANKTRLGATQKTQLKADLLASTAVFKLIVTSKNTYGMTGGSNTDDWDAYSTERDEILAYIDSNSITGVIWISGDQHYPHIESQNDVDHTYNHIMLCPCPAAQIFSSVTPTINKQTIWADNSRRVFGLISVYADYCDLAICDIDNGNVLIRYSIAAGSNTHTVRNTKVSI